MLISKSDYIKYYQCPKAFWLNKNRKDLIPEDIQEKMAFAMMAGETVEAEAYKLFPEGIKVDNYGFQQTISQTSKLIMDNEQTLLQPSFFQDNLFCRCDVIKKLDGCWDIYEIKAATSVKEEYIPDLAFQKACLEKSGLKTGRAFVIHVNKEYIRNGEIEPREFLITEEVSGQVDEWSEKVEGDAEKMLCLAGDRQEPEVRILKQCQNPYECMFIPYCWREIPRHSIYNIYPSEDEINELLDNKIVELKDVPGHMIKKEKYARYQEAIRKDQILIDKHAIRKELDNYEYPIYFLDYETNAPAVPRYDGYRPYQRIVFQYSLHVLEKAGGKLKHFEFLADSDNDPSSGLAETLSKQIGNTGTVVAWFKGFEAGCNTEMGERCPKHKKFFDGINGRLLDLMDFFANGYYVDKEFTGSASLKKVLPVIVPQLSYKELNIQEGMAASNAWPVLIGRDLSEKEKEALKDDMLKYCELDTYAMVEIFRILNEIALKQ